MTGLFTRASGLVATGLNTTDRIVELAAVVFRGDGEILDEYATVLDPMMPSSSAARELHGLSDADLAGVPRVGAVLPELWALSAGTVMVSHNLEFTQQFLVQESRHAELSLPSMLALCTLRTAWAQLDGRTFKLGPLYRTATGQWHDDQHTALGDARAVSALLCWMLRLAPGGLYLQDWPPPAGPAVRPRPTGPHRSSADPRAEQRACRFRAAVPVLAHPQADRTGRGDPVPGAAGRGSRW